MLAGVNTGEQPSGYQNSSFVTAKNRLHSGHGWQVAAGFSGTLTTQLDGTPISWLAGSPITAFMYSPSTTLSLDGMDCPNHNGQWGLQYTDANVNTSSALVAWLQATSGGAIDVTVTPVSLSGPHVGTATNPSPGYALDPRDVTINPTNGVLSIANPLVFSTPGSGYQGAGIWACAGQRGRRDPVRDRVGQRGRRYRHQSAVRQRQLRRDHRRVQRPWLRHDRDRDGRGGQRRP